ncbi:Splicing factor [Tulasnella sp. 418]|nr:Splicing factor [Tulasnella sp. 418]
MDIDDNQATLDALDALSSLLPALQQTPLSYKLHYQYLRLVKTAGLDDQLTPARETLVANLAAADDIWAPLLQAKVEEFQFQPTITPDSFSAIDLLFEQAEADYLSIPILKMHLEFLVDQHALAHQPSNKMYNGLSELCSNDNISQKLRAISRKASVHFSRGHEVWDARIEWEESLLPSLTGNARTSRLAALQEEFLERLQIPHTKLSQTFQNYSSFVSSHFPPEVYEETLVAANKVKQDASKVVDEMERFEHNLKTLQDYSSYLTWATSPKFEKPKWRGKGQSQKSKEIPPDPKVAVPLYERAITEAAKKRGDALSNEDQAAAEGPLAEAEAWLAVFWDGLIGFVKEHTPGKETEMPILERAVRSVPSNGNIIASLLRSTYMYINETDPDYDSDYGSDAEGEDDMEDGYSVKGSNEKPPGLHFAYRKAINSGILDAAGITAVTLPRASYEEDKLYAVGYHGGDERAFQRMKKILKTGIEMNREKGGDPSLKLEKFLTKLFMVSIEVPLEEDARELWKDAVKFYKTSYSAFSQYTRLLIQQREYEEASKVFKDAANPSRNLDYPQALWDEWVQFEELYRGFGPVEFAMMRVRLDETELKKLFRDCGEIREVKITKLANEVVALVEFMDKEGVPAALTKDKKRLQGNEIAVHLAWRSTLYITNFPEKADDEWIRSTFAAYGTLFDVRWPSKKFKSTRRFCYVQYVSPDAAKAALELNGKEMEPGHPMNVYISDPQRKKERTDANIEKRELYVAGLPRNTSQGDLETLFKECGNIKGIRLALDENGKAKGYAFVEFEQETSALQALAFNNHEFKKRRIAVTLADPHAPSRRAQPASGLSRKQDLKSRSVRIKNIPAGTQEAVLQQAIEKVATGVKKVELFEQNWQAVVEFNTIADAGRFLLLPNGFKYEGVELQLSEEGPTSSKPPAAASTTSFVPRAAGKPKAGLGFKKQTISAVAKSTSGKATSTSGQSQTQQASGSSSSGKDQDAFRAMLQGR